MAKLVWLGQGLYTRAGKTYRNGDVMPDDIDKKELDGLKKKNKVGNPIKAVDLSKTTRLIDAQKKLIKELQANISEKNDIISGMIDQISEKDELISNLQKDKSFKGEK